jgi:hypothetical protein
VLAAVDKFYSEVVQHIKPWAPAPPKIRDNDAAPSDDPISSDDILAADNDGYREDPDQMLMSGTPVVSG